MAAGRAKSFALKRKRITEMTAKVGSISVTPAVWLSPYADIGDCQYVDGDLDEIEIRALHSRVVYAGSLCCHHQVPFQDLTVDVIAAVERDARKNGRKRRTLLPKPSAKKVVVRKKVVPVTRVGPPLTAVVAEMFPKSREGRPLLEVVSSLFDS